MLATRLWMGAILVALTAGVLVGDQWLAPWYPFLLVVVLGLSLLACRELLQLLEARHRLPGWLCYLMVTLILLANWAGPIARVYKMPLSFQPWWWVASAFAVGVLAAFLAEMRTFREPGDSVPRIALVVWVAAYLGLLPSFLVQLRWLNAEPADRNSARASVALALAIFVPKCSDIGAYFTGRLLGRRRMAPVLSPKKTWEGAAGGLATAVLATVTLNRLGPALEGGMPREIGFGATVGAAGMLGDLAESLIKRDCRQKDASHVVPGFGGVLDVVDAVLFAAPVSYWWLNS